MRDAIRFLIDLAAVDSNLAQALRPNFGLVEGLLFGQDNEAERQLVPAPAGGQIVGNGGVERGGRHGEIRATIRRRGDHYVVNGTKYYSTGALYADWISSIALDEDGKGDPLRGAARPCRTGAGRRLRRDRPAPHRQRHHALRRSPRRGG